MKTNTNSTSYVRDLYKDVYTEYQVNFIADFKYKGKTADEWFQKANEATGVDEDGNPTWFQFQSNAEDTIILAKLILMGKYPKEGIE
ncbi:MAG TPA: hypothetical protein P5509_04255 [Bacteroidales bacterium]|nr:hypothetical protein [Bacteroidales bacterium]